MLVYKFKPDTIPGAARLVGFRRLLIRNDLERKTKESVVIFTLTIIFRFILGIYTCWEESYLRLGEVDKAALLLGEILRGPLFVFVDTLVLIHLNLIGAAEIIASTRRDVWHGSLENTTQRHHSPLHWITGGTRRRGVRSCHPRKTRKITDGATHCDVYNPAEHERTVSGCLVARAC